MRFSDSSATLGAGDKIKYNADKRNFEEAMTENITPELIAKGVSCWNEVLSRRLPSGANQMKVRSTQLCRSLYFFGIMFITGNFEDD